MQLWCGKPAVTSRFDASAGSWTQQTKRAAAHGDSEDRFRRAVSVATDGTPALVGAPQNENPNGARAGSAYVFEGAGDSWRQ